MSKAHEFHCLGARYRKPFRLFGKMFRLTAAVRTLRCEDLILMFSSGTEMTSHFCVNRMDAFALQSLAANCTHASDLRLSPRESLTERCTEFASQAAPKRRKCRESAALMKNSTNLLRNVRVEVPSRFLRGLTSLGKNLQQPAHDCVILGAIHQ